MDDINKLIQERDNLLKTTRHIEEQLHTINKMIELKKTEVQNSSEPKNYLEVRYLTKATSSSEKVGIQQLTLVDKYIWGGCTDGSICVWDIKTGRLVGSRRALKSAIISMKLIKYENSPQFLESASIWTGSTYQGITIWNTGLSKIKTLDDVKEVSCITQVDHLVWCGSMDGTITIYHHVEHCKVAKIDTPSPVRFMELVDTIMWVCTDYSIVRYDVNTFDVVDEPIPIGRVNSLVYIQPKSQIWGASSDHSIYIFSSDTGQKIYTIKDFSSERLLCLRNIDNHFIWSSGYDSVLRIWDVDNMELFLSLKQVHSGPVSAIEIVPYKNSKNQVLPTYWCADWEGEISIWV